MLCHNAIVVPLIKIIDFIAFFMNSGEIVMPILLRNAHFSVHFDFILGNLGASPQPVLRSSPTAEGGLECWNSGIME